MRFAFIPAAETAKLIRAALKRSFPRTRFSVRTSTYAGGASVDVSWTDGPAVKPVERVTGRYAGGRFDGSIDMAYGVKHWLLPDGSAAVAGDAGTLGQSGVHAPEREWMPHPEAKLVRFGADYVHTRRDYLDAFMARVLAKMRRDGFEWEGDEGPICDGWPMHAATCRLVRNDAARRVEGHRAAIRPEGRNAEGHFEGGDLLLTDVLHRVRHAFMVAAG